MKGSPVRGTATVLDFIADGDIGIGCRCQGLLPRSVGRELLIGITYIKIPL